MRCHVRELICFDLRPDNVRRERRFDRGQRHTVEEAHYVWETTNAIVTTARRRLLLQGRRWFSVAASYDICGAKYKAPMESRETRSAKCGLLKRFSFPALFLRVGSVSRVIASD